MTIETTEPAIASAEDVRRSSYTAALSLAGLILSDCTGTLPTSFEVTVHTWAPTKSELSFYFHRDVPGMRKFRDDQMLTETMTTRDDGSVYCEAVREDDDGDGVRVVAWVLMPAEAPAVAA
jgi:hypothetical protein